MHKKSTLFLSAVVFLALTGCADTIENTLERTDENEIVEREDEDEVRHLQIVENDIPAFDASLYEAPLTQRELEVSESLRRMDARISSSVLKANDGKNLVFSPYSLDHVLAMGINAVKDEVLEDVFGQYGLESQDLDAMNAVIRKSLNKQAALDKSVVLQTANKLWVDYSIPVYSSYVSVLKNFYDAETQAIDCSSSESSKTVNQWVEKQTNGLIRNVAGEGCVNWRTNLMNIVFMKAGWTSPFMDFKTSRQKFTNIDGSESEVDMMHQMQIFAYAQTESGKLLRMPLGYDGQYEVVFLLPDEMNSLTGNMLGELDATVDKCKNVKVDVLLPKLRIYNLLSLNDCVRSNGLSALLTRASYTRFSPGGEAPVGEILQHACLEFTEEGTAAAAVTMHMDTSDGEKHEQEVYDFHMNRPFLFFVRNSQDGTLLFVGRVCDAGN